jgi:activator of HSP90 ATPase
MAESFEVSAVFPTQTPEKIYAAWLDSQSHSAMTGSPAVVDPALGGKFSAWDEYIQGQTLELEPTRRILQAWRTTEFPEDSPDSRLEILIEGVDDGVKVTLLHSEIPEGQGENFRQGWTEFYFEPMGRYFSAETG